MQRFFLQIICGWLLTVLAASAYATMVIPASLNEMTAKSDLIFSGKCIDRQVKSLLLDDKETTLTVTEYTFEVTEWVKGSEGAVFSYQQYGSPPGWQPQPDANHVITFERIAGAPAVAVGWEGVLFLSTASSIGLRMPVGMQQGVFTDSRNGDQPVAVENQFRSPLYQRLPADSSPVKSAPAVADGSTAVIPAKRRPVESFGRSMPKAEFLKTIRQWVGGQP